MMIKIGKKTRYNFSFWWIVEVYMRILICAVLAYVIADAGINLKELGVLWFFKILFITWSLRPAYVNIRALIREWRVVRLSEKFALQEDRGK